MKKLFSLKIYLATCFTAIVISCAMVMPAAAAEKLNKPNQYAEASSNDTHLKTIGIIGGVSWVSSLEYYRLMNQMVRNKLGGLHSAQILMYSIEFAEFARQERLADQGDWRPLRKIMIDAAERLKNGGADFIVIASNTMNSSAEDIEEKVKIPVLHIADATGKKIKEQGLKSVILLGTTYTMESNFYRDRLEKTYGLKVIVPDKADRDYINTVIFDELCAEKINKASKEHYIRIINRLVKEKHAEGVILGCTEIPLLIKQEDVSVPVFDTTAIHAEAAVTYSLTGKQ
ncbi:MAG: aspartate/glutamate racemase family protein [Chlorobiaceae bacterium]